MKIVIPLAGLGTRLRPHTYSKPKPLVPVAGKPMLAHILDEIAQLDPEEIIFITGHLGEQIEAYVSRAYPQYNARYVKQEKLRGQSDAILLAREYVSGEMLIIFADTIFKAELGGLSRLDAEVVLHLRTVSDPRRFGVAVVDNETGYIKQLVEKPKTEVSNLAVVGVYYFRKAEQLFEAIEQQMRAGLQSGKEYYLADAMNLMLERGIKFRYRLLDLWLDCGTLEDLLDTNRRLLAMASHKTTPEDRPGVKIIPPVYIASGAVIEDSIIGPYASIDSGTTIQTSEISDSIIGTDTVIQNCNLKNSVVGSHASIRGVQGRLNLGDNSEIASTI